MKLDATKTERVQVDVSPRTAWAELRIRLLNAANISAAYLKEDGWFYEHYHGSVTDSRKAQATPYQIEVYNAVKLLDQLVTKVKE